MSDAYHQAIEAVIDTARGEFPADVYECGDWTLESQYFTDSTFKVYAFHKSGYVNGEFSGIYHTGDAVEPLPEVYPTHDVLSAAVPVVGGPDE